MAAPWVIVSGGFHKSGGMDKANLALAEYVVSQGIPVHLVCHKVDPDFEKNPFVTVHMVPRPAGSYFLGRPLLDRCGRRIAQLVTARYPQARVVVNGGNCRWPDINWVHYVHHAWQPNPLKGPLWFRLKQIIEGRIARKKERAAAHQAKIFICNSDRTRRDLIELLGVDPRRARTVYLGAESEWGPVNEVERAANQEALALSAERLCAVFVGSLGLDNRKGFDTLLKAWVKLCGESEWDVDLLVAGSGDAQQFWQNEISRCGLKDRVRVLGFTDKVKDLLTVADVLVSPVRYEAYGLNVQEAICRGIPAVVSAGAGVAERYGKDVSALLLTDPEDADGLVEALRRWRADIPLWKAHFHKLGEELRRYGWRDMAEQIVSAAPQGSAQDVNRRR